MKWNLMKTNEIEYAYNEVSHGHISYLYIS